MSESTRWRVGQLAEAAGLTVRTLHHWDAVGLLEPSRRTPAGHREYTEADVVRLYQIMALRALGLSLESVGTCLDAGVDPGRLVRDHLATVSATIDRLGALRTRLEQLDAELGDEKGLSGASLLDALAATGRAGRAVEHVLSGHLDEEQFASLRDRAADAGPAAPYLLEIEWPELYRRADRLRRAGVPPGAAEPAALVARLDELSALFSGGDRALSAGVREAWHEAPAEMSGDPGASADEYRELTDYLDRARVARGRG